VSAGALRDRARQPVENGAVTERHGADRDTLIQLLNDALATELVCHLNYKRHYHMATGLRSSTAADKFIELAHTSEQHADRLAERIVQLGGEPDFNPDNLTERAHTQYAEGNGLRDMVFENLVAERIAIDSYREIVQYIGDQEPATRRIFENILARKEQHADELASLLDGMN